MGRRRRRRSRGGVSRRRFLAGGLLCLGGASILGGTQAFSQVDATRGASIETAEDGSALLGIDSAASVQAGREAQYMAAFTNNTDSSLDISTSLNNNTDSEVIDGEFSLTSGETRDVEVNVSEDHQIGDSALSFDVTGESGDSMEISVTRHLEVTPPPTLKKMVVDNSIQSAGAQFQIFYEVKWVPDFSQLQLTIDNNIDHIQSFSDSSNDVSGSFTYAPEGGGSYNGEYEFIFDVFGGGDSDTPIITDTVDDQADGDSPEEQNDELGDENDPSIQSYEIIYNGNGNHADYTVNYTVTNDEQFAVTQVHFDPVPDHQSDAAGTESSNSNPGSVSYYNDGGGWMSWEITIEVYKEIDNGQQIPVDSESEIHDPQSN